MSSSSPEGNHLRDSEYRYRCLESHRRDSDRVAPITDVIGHFEKPYRPTPDKAANGKTREPPGGDPQLYRVRSQPQCQQHDDRGDDVAAEEAEHVPDMLLGLHFRVQHMRVCHADKSERDQHQRELVIPARNLHYYPPFCRPYVRMDRAGRGSTRTSSVQIVNVPLSAASPSEASFERAILASPVPPMSDWKLPPVGKL